MGLRAKSGAAGQGLELVQPSDPDRRRLGCDTGYPKPWQEIGGSNVQLLLPPLLRVNFLSQHTDFPRLSLPSLCALTCAPCDRPPSAISPDKVRPLLDSALASASSVPRFRTRPAPSWAPDTDWPTGVPPPPPRLTRPEGTAEEKVKSGAHCPVHSESGSALTARSPNRKVEALGSAAVPAPPAAAGPSVASPLPARRPGAGLGSRGSRELGAPMRRRVAAPLQL